MTVYCQGCREAFDYDAARENPPEGDTRVEVTHNPVNKDGCRTDYFCSPHCLVKFVNAKKHGVRGLAGAAAIASGDASEDDLPVSDGDSA
jgi:hypothetical protein